MFSAGVLAYTALLPPGPQQLNAGRKRPWAKTKHNVRQYGTVSHFFVWLFNHSEVFLKHNSKHFANSIKAEFQWKTIAVERMQETSSSIIISLWMLHGCRLFHLHKDKNKRCRNQLVSHWLKLWLKVFSMWEIFFVLFCF